MLKWIHFASTSIFYWASTGKNVCRQMFSSLLGMSGGGHFSGNMRTFFIRHNSSCKPIVLSWQGAPQKHVSSYIKFAISDLHPSFKWEREKKKRVHVKQSGRERERESEDRRSYREETSKDDSNFLMESPETGDWCASERATVSSGVKRQDSGQGYKLSSRTTGSFTDSSIVKVKH